MIHESRHGLLGCKCDVAVSIGIFFDGIEADSVDSEKGFYGKDRSEEEN